MNNTVHMAYSSSLTDLCEINSSFDTGVLRIAYHGKNRNGSYISKEAFERCIPTIYNCPVVCNYNRETDSIGGHDMEIVSDTDGIRLVNVTIPVGVVPESSRYFWSIVEEEDGTEHEYLCVDVLIWKRQEAYRKIKYDGITAHSMEVSIKDSHMNDDVFVIDDFEFTAFCLLGDEHEPCFESSALSLFTYDEMKREFAQMMAELKEHYAVINAPDGADDIHPQIIMTEGGEKVLNEKLALAAEFGFDVDGLDFSIDELTVEELRDRFEAMAAEKNTDDPATAVDPTEPSASFALSGQIQDEIYSALAVEKIECSWGEMARYHYVDHDHDALQVYCYDAEDWKLYGFTYAMNGDSVVIDFESKKRMKFAIVEFDEGEQSAPFAAVFGEMSKQYTENDTKWSEKYQSASDTISSMENELGSLRQFKTDTEEAAAALAREEVFAQFEDLIGVEEFETLKEHSTEYGPEALEEKCFAIRGRYGVSAAKFEREMKLPKIKVDKNNQEDEPYGGLFLRFPPRC